MYLKCCFVVTWLVPRETSAFSVHILCTPYSHAPVYSFIWSHILYICVFSCNLPPVLLAEWPWSFACYCSNMGRGGWSGCWRVSTESWPWGRKFAHHSWWDLNLQPFDHESGTLPMGYPCSLDHSLWVCLLGQTSHKESQISCFCHHTPYQALAQTSAQTYWKLNNKKIKRWIITQNN